MPADYSASSLDPNIPLQAKPPGSPLGVYSDLMGLQNTQAEIANRKAQLQIQQNQNQQFQKIMSDADTYFLLRQRALSGNFPESYRLSVKKYIDALGILFLKSTVH